MPKDKSRPIHIPSLGAGIDLHGMTVDEAVPKVDSFLHDSFVAGLYEVRIVHGKGSGILREEIRRMLAHHPLVKSYRSGGYYEGGYGVTIVELTAK